MRKVNLTFSAVAGFMAAALLIGTISHDVAAQKQGVGVAPSALVNPMRADGGAPPPPPVTTPPPKAIDLQFLQADGGAPPPPPVTTPPPKSVA